MYTSTGCSYRFRKYFKNIGFGKQIFVITKLLLFIIKKRSITSDTKVDNYKLYYFLQVILNILQGLSCIEMFLIGICFTLDKTITKC